MINAPEHHSKPFNLHPGLRTDNGDKLTECVVRLLTRKDQKEIAREPKGSEEDAALARAIVRIGNLTDRSEIMVAIDQLALVDELRIRQKMADLEAECLAEGAVIAPVVRKIFDSTDIVSKPFTLNPGICVDGVWHKTAIVRLLRRGEIKLIQREPDPIKADDLTFLHTVAQIGNITAITMAHIDLLTDGDMKRIIEERDGLEGCVRPLTKSDE